MRGVRGAQRTHQIAIQGLVLQVGHPNAIRQRLKPRRRPELSGLSRQRDPTEERRRAERGGRRAKPAGQQQVHDEQAGVQLQTGGHTDQPTFEPTAIIQRKVGDDHQQQHRAHLAESESLLHRLEPQRNRPETSRRGDCTSVALGVNRVSAGIGRSCSAPMRSIGCRCRRVGVTSPDRQLEASAQHPVRNVMRAAALLGARTIQYRPTGPAPSLGRSVVV